MSIRPNRQPVVSPELAELLAGGSGADLLKIIGDERERNRQWAEAALTELYKRHVGVLYPLCRRICAVYLADESQAENLLNRTFWRVFRVAERFDPGRTRCGGDAACLDRSVRYWIVRQARWLAKDIIGRAVGRAVEHDGQDALDQVGREDEEPPECSPEVTAAIDRLPGRERHVVLAYYFYTDCETDKPVPPDEAVDAYCARRWGTTAENVRKIRSRALAMLREWLTPAAPRPAATR
jgi:RNA polymerase sigma factor (sigma-70 family)